MLCFTMILALFPGIGDLLFVKVAFRAPKVTSSRKGTAHRQNLYTQTPDSPHACGRLVAKGFYCSGVSLYHDVHTFVYHCALYSSSIISL